MVNQAPGKGHPNSTQSQHQLTKFKSTLNQSKHLKIGNVVSKLSFKNAMH